MGQPTPPGAARTPDRVPAVPPAPSPVRQHRDFAPVMATGICSSALLAVGRTTASAVLLCAAGTGFAVLLVALAVRLRRPRVVLRELAAPERAFAYFTLVAAADVLAARLSADGHRALGIGLTCFAAAVWLGLTYTVPVGLVLGSRTRPPLAAVDGTWFLWTVGTQSLAVSLATLDATGGGHAPVALLAVLTWSVGVVLYLVVATLVLARLLLHDVRPHELTPAYWVTMGATAITVLAAAQILTAAPAPAVTATRSVLSGLGVVLWAFGTWLIPLLVAFGLWRRVRHREPVAYQPALWSVVFPLGMYAEASMRIGTAAHLPLVERIGRAWTWVAVLAWLIVSAAMCHTLARAAWHRLHSNE